MTNGIDTAQLDDKVEAVLIPETAGLPSYPVGGYQLRLKPLPLKQARILNGHLKGLEKAFSAEDAFFDIADKLEDIYVGACAHLLNYYGVQGASKEWIAENLASGEARALIEAQLEVEHQHSFLRVNAATLFAAMDAFLRKTSEIAQEIATNFQPSSPSSVSPSPGVSIPTASSSPIPKGS